MAAPLGSDWRSKYPTTEQQAEFFLLKFGTEVARDAVFTLKKQFERYDGRSQGELEEDEAMRLLENRNETKTFTELRQMVADIDLDKNRKLSFLEWACAIFNKSWVALHTPSVDPEEVARAEALSNQAFREAAEKQAKEAMALQLEEEARLATLRAAAEKAAAEHGVEAAKAAQEALDAEIKRQFEERRSREEQQRAEEQRKAEEAAAKRKEELSRSGVAGKAAFFKYAVQDHSVDSTASNRAKIEAEARARKAEKEAKAKADEDRKRAEEDAKRAQQQAEEKAREEEIAKEEARKAADAKAAAEAERLEAERKQAEAEAVRLKAMEGTEVAERERRAYEEAKRQAEELERQKKEAEEKKRAEGRAKIHARAALWNQAASPGAVVSEIKEKGSSVSLNKTATRESTVVTQAKLLGNIKKGAELKPVDKPSDGLSEVTRQAFLEDRAAQQ